MYSTKIYQSWRNKQQQKYRQITKIIQPHLNQQMTVLDIGIEQLFFFYETLRKRKLGKRKSNKMTVLDVGVGQGWIYEEFEKQGIQFKRIVGIEPDENMMKKNNTNIEYHNTTIENFKTTEKFDLLISFDSLHLIKKPKQILKYLKPNGLALISIPMHHKNILKQFEDNIILEQGKIGKEEVDYFILIKVD